MPRLAQWLALILTATPLALAGCGGSGTETASNDVPQDRPRDGNRKPDQSVTPAQVLDPKGENSVVKGEVEGGESANPTPIPYRYSETLRSQGDPG